MQQKRGKLIVIEGTDCSGKSTQINLLIKKLKEEGFSVVTLDFPNYVTPTGKLVRKYLENEFGPANDIDPKIASVFYAVDRYVSKSKIEEALGKNEIVILDRYVESNMGHQGGKIKDKEKREKYFKWLEKLEYGDFQLPKPELILFFHMPHEVSLKLKENRIRKSENHPGEEDGHEGNKEHLKNAEEAYLHLAKLYNWEKVECAPDKTINSLKKPEEIHKEVWEIIEDLKIKKFK